MAVRLYLAGILAAVLFSWAAFADAAAKPLILAVHPFLPEVEIQQRFAPLANYLGKVLDRDVVVRIGGNYDQHIDAIGTDRVDIAFLGPVSYVRMLERHGSKPLLGRFEVNHQPHLYGVIAMRKDRTLRTLADLKGQRFAFGDPESTMSHIVPRAMLAENGVTLATLAAYKHLGSHSNVALGVLAGDFDAGAMKKEVFDEFAPRGLAALAITPPTPDHLFVTRADLPGRDVARLRQALLQLHALPEGPAILSSLHNGLTAIVPAQESDYAALGRMARSMSIANATN